MKHALTLAIGILLTFAATSQNSTTAIPNEHLRTAITVIERAKVLEQEVDLLNQKIKLLQVMIANRQHIIDGYTTLETNYEAELAGWRAEVQNLEAQKAALGREIADLRKQVKRQKTQKKVIFAGFVLALGLCLFK